MTAHGLKIHLSKIHGIRFGDAEKVSTMSRAEGWTSWSEEETAILEKALKQKLKVSQISALGLIKGRTEYAIQKKALGIKRGKPKQSPRNGPTVRWEAQGADIIDHWDELCNRNGRAKAIDALRRNGAFQGRSTEAILHKVWNMQKDGNLDGIPWVESEITALKLAWKNCGGNSSKSYAHITEELDRLGFVRSIQSVATQLESMGMALSPKQGEAIRRVNLPLLPDISVRYRLDWTKEEDEALLEATSKGMSPTEIYETGFIPNRTKGSISGRMTALSLTSKQTPIKTRTQRKTDWTQQEEQVLRDYADQLGKSKRRAKAIRKIISKGILRGRSLNAIQHKFWEMQKNDEIRHEVAQSPLDYLETHHKEPTRELSVSNVVDYLRSHPRNLKQPTLVPSSQIGVDANRPLATGLKILDELHKRGCEAESWNKHLGKMFSLVGTVYTDIEFARKGYQKYVRWQEDPDYQEFKKFQNQKFEATVEAKEQEIESQVHSNLIVDRELKQPT